MKNKLFNLKPEDIKGKHDLKIDLNDTVPYEYFFKKIEGKVYRFYRINNGEWEADESPYFEEPFIYWSGNNNEKNTS